MKTLLVLGILAGMAIAGFCLRGRLLAMLFRLYPASFDAGANRSIPVSMPDGVRLMTDHYTPRGQGLFPTILIRTPYGRGKDGSPKNLGMLALLFAERGYNVIIQDVRGCFQSEGEFSPFFHDAEDGRFTAKWIAEQPWFDGSLGTWGPSYLGYVQWALADTDPPQLKAMAPITAGPGLFAVCHPDGAFALDVWLQWIHLLHVWDDWAILPWWKKLWAMVSMVTGRMARELEPSYNHLPLLDTDMAATGKQVPFYREMLSNRRPDDPYWKYRDHSCAVSRTKVPVCLVAGWYDIHLRGMLHDYGALRANRQNPFLTIGPWSHADPGLGLAAVREGLTWFDAHLKGDRSRLRERPVRIYIMGANRWRELDEWPPPAVMTRWFLHGDSRLSKNDPAANSPPDRYRYDPRNPTPAVGGARIERSQSGRKDNRALEARSDVLTYSTSPLDEDLEIIGPVRLELFVYSSRPYTDFFGRLCDVDAKSRSTNICDGLVRIEPGKGEPQSDGSLRIEIDMWATAYRFTKGHRIRLQVSSGAHPRWSRNLGTGDPLPTATSMETADQTILHDTQHPSALVLPAARAAAKVRASIGRSAPTTMAATILQHTTGMGY